MRPVLEFEVRGRDLVSGRLHRHRQRLLRALFRVSCRIQGRDSVHPWRQYHVRPLRPCAAQRVLGGGMRGVGVQLWLLPAQRERVRGVQAALGLHHLG